MSNSARRLYEFEGFRLDPAERLLVRAGAPVPLAPKAFEMLVVLVGNSGRLLTKDELLRAVWADAVVEENNLDKNISALRKALGESNAERKLIETVRGHGYRFNATVTELAAPEAFLPKIVTRQDVTLPQIPTANELEPAVRAHIAPQPDTPAPHPPAPLVERHGKLGLAVATVLLLAVAITLWVKPWRDGQRGAAVPRELKVARMTNGGYIIGAVLSPKGSDFVYIEKDGVAGHLWLGQTAGGQPSALEPELSGTFQGLTYAPDGQSVYLAIVDRDSPQGALYRVPTHGGPVSKVLTGIASPVTFAPDGQRLAFIRADEKSENTSLVLADLTSGNERIVLTRNGLERLTRDGPSWSPDGKEIACQLFSGMTQSSDAVWRVVGVDVASGAQRLLTTQQWDGCGRLVWLRDGSGLVMVGTKQGESSTTARDAVWFIAQPDGAVRRITTDLSRHYYRSLSVTDDGQALLVLPFNRSSQIWSVAARGSGAQTRYAAASAVQLTTGTGEGRAGIVSLDDGHFVYVARTGEHVDLWQMRNDGSQAQQLTTDPPFLEEVSAPPAGSYLVFASNRAGNSHLFRVNRDGKDLRQLTSGEGREIESACSPDGHWIVYPSQASEPGQIATFKLWKIPAEGGTPIKLTEHEAHSPHFSPDSQWISYVYLEPSGSWRAAIIRAEGGAPVKTFALPSTVESNLGCRWTPDGQGLTFIVKGKTFDNLWRQPLDGRAPTALTDFKSGEIYNYAFARGGQRLFLARGYSIRDVLLIREF
jgi:Tol biopolymer transport system component/DNA-binding winged helix-turn-helix (wHTH) protein